MYSFFKDSSNIELIYQIQIYFNVFHFDLQINQVSVNNLLVVL